MTATSNLRLDHYKRQAKNLLKHVRAGDPDARLRFQHAHPEGDILLASGRLLLSDSQLVIAREWGFGSWAKFKHALLFGQAVAALDAGDLAPLDALLHHHPWLIQYRQRLGPWYESGYFAGAMLLHHVAGNPIRGPIPANILDVTRLLLQHGANPNAATLLGATTCKLLLTSLQASEAGVAVPLCELLIAAGARNELSDPDVLSSPLRNGAPATAAALVRRGAVMDLRHAAALGALDRVQALLDAGVDADLCEEALFFACLHRQQESARLLLHYGASGSRLIPPGDPHARTALHDAAGRGYLEMVLLLLEHRVDATVVDPQFGGTARGWARHEGHAQVVAALEPYLQHQNHSSTSPGDTGSQ
ncbi:MAG TPA: ankyrin repeat domain-containing protein [Ktedonobacterales bacterium]|nr:ankyrin repeat domain-containing protein [Ktedonobacterales bacterium]